MQTGKSFPRISKGISFMRERQFMGEKVPAMVLLNKVYTADYS